MVRRAVIPDEDEYIPGDDDGEETLAEATLSEEDEDPAAPAPPRSRRQRQRVVDEDGEEEKRPPVRKKPPSSNGSKKRVIKGGWQAGQKAIDNNKGPTTYAKAYQDTNVSQILKFLGTGAPYASYARHWVARVDAEGNKRNRPYVCLGTFDEACPLCDVLGDRPQTINSFNIAVLDDEPDEDGEHGITHYTWDVGPRLFDTLKGHTEDPKVGTLTKGFWVSKRSGKGLQTIHHVSHVRSNASLLEDWSIVAPADEVYEDVTLYTADIISVPTYEELEEIAEELASSDDYD